MAMMAGTFIEGYTHLYTLPASTILLDCVPLFLRYEKKSPLLNPGITWTQKDFVDDSSGELLESCMLGRQDRIHPSSSSQ